MCGHLPLASFDGDEVDILVGDGVQLSFAGRKCCTMSWKRERRLGDGVHDGSSGGLPCRHHQMQQPNSTKQMN